MEPNQQQPGQQERQIDVGPIKSIRGAEPSDGSEATYFAVGRNGVTEIAVTVENFGQYGIQWYLVLQGDTCIARMNALGVVETHHDEPSRIAVPPQRLIT